MSKPNQLPIGEVASRTGLSVSAIRYYEERGLVTAVEIGADSGVLPALTSGACPL